MVNCRSGIGRLIHRKKISDLCSAFKHHRISNHEDRERAGSHNNRQISNLCRAFRNNHISNRANRERAANIGRSRSESREVSRDRSSRRHHVSHRSRARHEIGNARRPTRPIDINDYIPDGFDRNSLKHPVSSQAVTYVDIRAIGRRTKCTLAWDKINFPGQEVRYIYMRGREIPLSWARRYIDEDEIKGMREEMINQMENLNVKEYSELPFMYWIEPGCVEFFASESSNAHIVKIEKNLGVKIRRVQNDPRVLKIIGGNMLSARKNLEKLCRTYTTTKSFSIRAGLIKKLFRRGLCFESLQDETSTEIFMFPDPGLMRNITITGSREDRNRAVDEICMMINELEPSERKKNVYRIRLHEDEEKFVIGKHERVIEYIEKFCHVKCFLERYELCFGDNCMYIEGTEEQAKMAADMMRFKANNCKTVGNLEERYYPYKEHFDLS